MFWKKHIEEGRNSLYKLTDKDKEAALLLLCSEPIYTYLMSVVDEHIRQGIYLSATEQEKIKGFVEILGKEIGKGKELKAKQDRAKRSKK